MICIFWNMFQYPPVDWTLMFAQSALRAPWYILRSYFDHFSSSVIGLSPQYDTGPPATFPVICPVERGACYGWLKNVFPCPDSPAYHHTGKELPRTSRVCYKWICMGPATLGRGLSATRGLPVFFLLFKLRLWALHGKHWNRRASVSSNSFPSSAGLLWLWLNYPFHIAARTRTPAS